MGPPRAAVAWKHSDSAPDQTLAFALAAKQYVTRPDGTPLSTADRVRVLRALGVATLDAIETMKTAGKGLPEPGEMETRTIVGRPLAADQFPSTGHATAAGILAIPFMLFADPGRRPVYAAVTHDGDPANLDAKVSVEFGQGPRAANDTGLAPLLLALVIVVVAAASTAAIAYATQCAGNIVDRKLGSDTATARMIAAHATAVQIVAMHNDREREAKKALPYSAEEKQILDASLAAAGKVAAETGGALPDPFAELARKAAAAADKAVDSVWGWGLGLAAVVGAFVVLKQ